MNAPARERKKHYRACHLCEAICGVVIETRGTEILSIKGDKDDPLSRGHLCPKAIALKDLHEDPDRLRQPLKRVTNSAGENSWETISWEEALTSAAQGLVDVHERHGSHFVHRRFGEPGSRQLDADLEYGQQRMVLPAELQSLWLRRHLRDQRQQEPLGLQPAVDR